MKKSRILALLPSLALALSPLPELSAETPSKRVTRLQKLAKDLHGGDKKKAEAAQTAFREDLRSQIVLLREAMRAGRKSEGLKRVKVILPNRQSVQAAFRKSVSKEDLDKVANFYKTLIPQDDEALAQVLKVDPRYTRIKVHQASTKELQDYKKNSVAWNHFPGGCKRLAKSYLREQLFFYIVEFLKPEAKRGLKYHLFFWNGEGWTMLGPVWRVFR